MFRSRGMVMFPEDVEKLNAEALQQIFEGKTSMEGVAVEKYVDTELTLLSYLPNGNEKRETINIGDIIKCGKCGEKNKVVPIIKDLPRVDVTQFYDLAATVIFRLKWDKIVKDVEAKKLDKYDALKGFKTLELMRQKRKENLTDNVTIHTPILCHKCKQEIGILDGRFYLNSKVRECKEVTETMINSLSKPSPDIMARVCKRIGIHPVNFDTWLKCAWNEQLKNKVEAWKNDLKTLNAPEDLNYQIDSFLSEIVAYAEDEVKKRKGKFAEALDYIIEEDLHDLRV